MAATGNLPFGEVADSTEDSQSENNSQNDSGKEDVKVEKYIVSQITNAVSSGQYIVSSVRYEFDEDGVLTSVEFYDENGKPYKQETYYASGKMRAEVNVRSDGKIIRSVQYNPEGNVQQIEEKKYDEHGMPIWQLQEMGGKTYVTEMEYEYDVQGRVVKVTSCTSYNGTPGSATTEIVQYKKIMWY